MPQTSGTFSRSKRAGEFERNRPLVGQHERVNMDELGLHRDLQLWWDPSGELYLDSEFTEPVGLTIVRPQ